MRWLRSLLNVFSVAAFLLGGSRTICAQRSSLGIQVDRALNAINLFDPERATFIAGRPIPAGRLVDAVLTPDLTIAYVADASTNTLSAPYGQIRVVDLSSGVPQLVGDPIVVNNNADDLLLTDDARYLLCCSGNAPSAVDVVDLLTREVVFSLPNTKFVGAGDEGYQGIDWLPDGTLLAGCLGENAVHRLTFERTPEGVLVQRAGILPNLGGLKAYSAPGGDHGILLHVPNTEIASSSFVSFSIPSDPFASLQVIDRELHSGTRGLSAVFGQADATPVVILRANIDTTAGVVQAFPYNPATGIIGGVAPGTPVFTLPVARSSEVYGAEQLALSPAGDLLFIPENQRITVYDIGAQLQVGSIVYPNTMIQSAGIRVREFSAAAVVVDAAPGDDSNTLKFHPKRGVQFDVAVLSDDGFDASILTATDVVLGDPAAIASGAAAVAPRSLILTDADGDGDVDAVYAFEGSDLLAEGAISASTTSLLLTGLTATHLPFGGADAVTVTGLKNREKEHPGKGNGPRK
jgi:hypothetical protein